TGLRPPGPTRICRSVREPKTRSASDEPDSTFQEWTRARMKGDEGQGIHALKRNLHARYGENYTASRPRHAARSSGVAHSPSAPASPSSDSEPYPHSTPIDRTRLARAPTTPTARPPILSAPSAQPY